MRKRALQKLWQLPRTAHASSVSSVPAQATIWPCGAGASLQQLAKCWFTSSCSHAAAERDTGGPRLSWPLAPEVLAANPQLAHAAQADAQLKQNEGGAAAAAPDAAAGPDTTTAADIAADTKIHLLGTEGSEAMFGGVQRPRREPRPAAAVKPPSLEPTATLTSDEIGTLLADAHAMDVCILDVHRRCAFADEMVVATGQSNGHVRALAQAVHYKLKQLRPQSEGSADDAAVVPVEGGAGSEWAIVDAGATIVHVLTAEAREEYALEELWATDARTRHITTQQNVQTLSTMRL